MGTNTSHLNLYIPTDGERNWGAPGTAHKVSYNFTLIDGAFVAMDAALAAHAVTGKHDHLAENTTGHGIIVDNTLDLADGIELGENFIELMFVYC